MAQDRRLGSLGIDRDAVPGIVVVWSREEPRHAAYRILDGLVIGRDEVLPWDDHASRQHARLTIGASGRIEVADLGRSQTSSSALPDGDRAQISALPAFLLVGRSVVAAVADVRPYEGITIERIGTLVVAGTLGPLTRELDAVARAEEHVLIAGPLGVIRELGQRYATTIGNALRYRPGGDQHLDHALGTRGASKTVVIDLSRPLDDRDQRALINLLETDVSIALLVSDEPYLADVPQQLIARARRFEVPAVRFDELPTTIHERVRAVVPGATVHASAIVHLLDHLVWMGSEHAWSQTLDGALEWWRTQGRTELRYEDLRYDFFLIGPDLPGTMLARPGRPR